MSGTPDSAPMAAGVDPVEGVTRGFLFADLRGYTEYVERHGGEDAAALLARYRTLVRAQVARFRGAEIKTEGDSFYVVFPSASAAVRAGLAIIDAAADETLTRPEQPIRVGVGVHAGETFETSEGYVGSPVNIAARLSALAGPGELLVSDTVRALTSTVIRARFVSRGRRQLKGIKEPLHVFAVSDAAAPAAVRATVRTRQPALGLGAAVLVGGVAVVAIAALALRGGAGSPTSLPATGTATVAIASAAPTPGSGVTGAERDLLEVLPEDVVEYCEIAREDALANATATARCELPIGSGADVVLWHSFPNPGETALAFDNIVRRNQVPDTPCGPEASPGRETWNLGRTFSGDRACYANDDGAWAVWTYGAEQILVEAVRTDGDAAALDEWREFIAQYLKGF